MTFDMTNDGSLYGEACNSGIISFDQVILKRARY